MMRVARWIRLVRCVTMTTVLCTAYRRRRFLESVLAWKNSIALVGSSKSGTGGSSDTTPGQYATS